MDDIVKGLAANHGFWPRSPDGVQLFQTQNGEQQSNNNRHLKPSNPSVTQFWQNTAARKKSASDEDIARAFLVLEANVPKTAFYGSREENRVDATTGSADVPLQEQTSSVNERGQPRTLSPKLKGSRIKSSAQGQRFARDTIASALKVAGSDPNIYRRLDGQEFLIGYRRQLELEKIYGHNYTAARQTNRVGLSSAASVRNAQGSVDLKKKNRSAETRQKSSAEIVTRGMLPSDFDQRGDMSSNVTDEDRLQTEQKQIYQDFTIGSLYPTRSNLPVVGDTVPIPAISLYTESDTDYAFKNDREENGQRVFSKDSTDSTFDISAMPQPTFSRARFRDRSPYRQTIGSAGKNNHHDNNNSNTNSSHISQRDSGRRRRQNKVSDEKITDNALEVRRELTEVELVSNEEKLESYLKECLTECSRQRLRAIHMSMRRLGNVESRISLKDLNQAFQENTVKLSNRVFHLINQTFVDHLGIDYERLHRSMMRAQMMTRRDSVEAMLNQTDPESRTELSREQRGTDLLRRMEEQLILDQTYFDLDELKKSVQEKDKDETGRILKTELYRSCSDVHIPLYGALLNNLVNHCDGGKSQSVSWPDFMGYLEKSQKSAIAQHPEMAELPEKAKQKQMASPLDLMDPEKKSRIVRTLLKKASESKVNVFAANTALAEQEPEEKIPVPDTAPIPQTDDVTVAIETETPKEAEELPSERARKLFQRVRSSAGFLSSVRGLLAGKKRGDSDLSAPIMEVENSSDMAAEEPELQPSVGGITASQADTPADSVVTLRIKGKDVALRKPAGYSADNASVDLPKEQLELDWVYGYRGNDCRSNIFVLANNEIAYFTANVVVLYDRDAHSQRHYVEHTEKIKSMAVHSNGVTIATGQLDSKSESSNEAHIRIWKSDTLDTLHVLGIGKFEKAVMCMSFPKVSLPQPSDTDEPKLFNAEDQLVAIDNSPEKNVTVWDVSSGELTGQETLEAEVICDVEFNPKYPDTFVTIGKEHVAWWRLDAENSSLQRTKQPVYDNYMKAKFVVCLTHTRQGDLITGDSNGTVYVWADGGNKITNFIKHAHDGPVFSLLLHNSVLMTGGRDSMIKSWQWGKTLDPLHTSEIPKSDGGVRMLVIHRGCVLIGTTTNSILSGVMTPQGTSPLDGMKLEDMAVTQGHYGDCRGLAITGDGKQRGHFVTTALDGIICVFSADRHEALWKLAMKGTTFQTVDASPTGNLLVFGTKDGLLVILNVLEGRNVQEQYRHKITKDKVTCVKLSPDMKSVAVGIGDRLVCIYTKLVKEDGMVLWELQGKCKGHHGSITSIDWSTEMSEDSYFLRTCSSAPEQLFWKVKSFEKVDNVEDIQHICWASNQCTLDISTLGLWTSTQADEGEVNGVDVNPAKTVVTMGDSQGYISVFKYPSCRQGAFSHTYKAHQSVQCLRFVSDGKYLVSLGGADSCIMQWKVV